MIGRIMKIIPLGKIAALLVKLAATLAFALICGGLSGINALMISDHFWPFEPEEAAGPIAARNISVLFLVVVPSFVAGCVISLIFWAQYRSTRNRTPCIQHGQCDKQAEAPSYLR